MIARVLRGYSDANVTVFAEYLIVPLKVLQHAVATVVLYYMGPADVAGKEES